MGFSVKERLELAVARAMLWPPGPHFIEEAANAPEDGAEGAANAPEDGRLVDAATGAPWLGPGAAVAARPPRKPKRAMLGAPRLRRLEGLYRQALSGDFALNVVPRKGSPAKRVRFLKGHPIAGTSSWYVPDVADVLVVSKQTTPEAIGAVWHMAGPLGRIWARALREVGALGGVPPRWHYCPLVRHAPFRGTNGPTAAQRADGLPLIMGELELVGARRVLCVGAVAAAPFREKGAKAPNWRDGPWSFVPAGGAAMGVWFVPDPAAALVTASGYFEFRDALAAFVEGGVPRRGLARAGGGPRHERVRDAARLGEIVDEILARPGAIHLAVDCEWEGEWWRDGWLRSVQFSPGPGEAYCVELAHAAPFGAEGACAFSPDGRSAFLELARLLACDRVEAGGHYFRADMPWLEREGVAVGRRYTWDTALMLRAVFDDEHSYKLETWAERVCGAPRYDGPVLEEVARIRSELPGGARLRGYGQVADDVLFPYGCWDVDVTSRLRLELAGAGGLLDRDGAGISSRAAFEVAMRSALAFAEIERRGMLLDHGRFEAMAHAFTETRAALLSRIQEEADWPDFNPASTAHVRELLFGADRPEKRERPEGALSLGLVPLKTTGAWPVPWEALDEEDDDWAVPSVDSDVLAVFKALDAAPVVGMLMDYRTLAKLTGDVLAPPDTDERGRVLRDAGGLARYGAGLGRHVGPDGRVRSRFYDTKTGRASSSSPNMQNISAHHEGDFKRILGERYRHALRSIFRAPLGHALVKVDITSAELWVVANLSGDAAMIEMVSRALLPEDDPRYQDAHAVRAVEAFRLNCAPTKKALASAGFAHLRTAAKTQIYGKLYGRGDRAMARQCRSEGADVTVEDMRRLSEAFDTAYPGVARFLAEARSRASAPRWIKNVYGRARRFPEVFDPASRARQERQAANFPIQGTVADAVNVAMGNFLDYREESGRLDAFHMVLQVHDELDFEVRLDCLEWFVDEVLPVCLRDRLVVPVAGLDGAPAPDGRTFQFHTGVDVYLNWGEKLTEKAAREGGVPSRFVEAH